MCAAYISLVATDETAAKNVTVAPGASVTVDLPSNGRVFRTERRVSIDDASPTGRMECDAVARFLQDGGNDDTDDAGLNEFGLAWVARKAMFEVRSAPASRELLSLATWCSGTGRRWAERSTQLRGEHGGHVDASVVWIHIDTQTGRPASWSDSFATHYLEASEGRQIDAKLRHSTDVPDGAGVPWRFRSTDMDAFGHVNNAAYLAIAEEMWGEDLLGEPHRIEIEWRKPSTAADELEIRSDRNQLWLVEVGSGDLRVTITCTPLGDAD